MQVVQSSRCLALDTYLRWQHVLPPEVKDAVNTPWFEDDGLPLRW